MLPAHLLGIAASLSLLSLSLQRYQSHLSPSSLFLHMVAIPCQSSLSYVRARMMSLFWSHKLDLIVLKNATGRARSTCSFWGFFRDQIARVCCLHTHTTQARPSAFQSTLLIGPVPLIRPLCAREFAPLSFSIDLAHDRTYFDCDRICSASLATQSAGPALFFSSISDRLPVWPRSNPPQSTYEPISAKSEPLWPKAQSYM